MAKYTKNTSKTKCEFQEEYTDIRSKVSIYMIYMNINFINYILFNMA